MPENDEDKSQGGGPVVSDGGGGREGLTVTMDDDEAGGGATGGSLGGANGDEDGGGGASSLIGICDDDDPGLHRGMGGFIARNGRKLYWNLSNATKRKAAASRQHQTLDPLLDEATADKRAHQAHTAVDHRDLHLNKSNSAAVAKNQVNIESLISGIQDVS